MGHAGQHDALEVREDALERLARCRRRCRQLFGDRARPHLRPHRTMLDVLEIIRHPVDERVAVAAKLVQVHGGAPSSSVAAEPGPRYHVVRHRDV